MTILGQPPMIPQQQEQWQQQYLSFFLKTKQAQHDN